MNVKGKSSQTSAAFLILLAALTTFCGCERAGSGASNNAASTASPQRTPLTAFERDLDFVRTGRFAYVYVIARPDNGVIDKDDKTYLKENTPRETNQWVSTDENRRVIAGTNFVFTPENMDALRKRFIVEDYSGR